MVDSTPGIPTAKFACMLQFSNYDWFMRESQTPFVLRVRYDWKVKKSERLYHFLNDFKPTQSYYADGDAVYSIILHPCMDRSQVVDFIESEVRTVLTYLKDAEEKST